MSISKKIIRNTALLGAFLFAGVAGASQWSQESIANECIYLGKSLGEAAKANSNETCSYDVSFSGSMMEHAGYLVQNGRIRLALEDFELIHRTLYRVMGAHDCPYFSSMVRPYVEKIEKLRYDTGKLPYAKQD